jgi:hypothetical protein
LIESNDGYYLDLDVKISKDIVENTPEWFEEMREKESSRIREMYPAVYDKYLNAKYSYFGVPSDELSKDDLYVLFNMEEKVRDGHRKGKREEKQYTDMTECIEEVKEEDMSKVNALCVSANIKEFYCLSDKEKEIIDAFRKGSEYLNPVSSTITEPRIKITAHSPRRERETEKKTNEK